MTNRIKEWRTRFGLTYARLGALTDTTAPQIQKLERGERRLTDVWMTRVAKGLSSLGKGKVDPADLLPLEGRASREVGTDTSTRDNTTNRIKEWRTRFGLTYAQLGKLANTTGPQIQKLECGQRRLTDAWMRRIAGALSSQGKGEVYSRDLLPPSDATRQIGKQRIRRDSRRSQHGCVFKMVSESAAPHDWKTAGVKIIPSSALDSNTPQTSGMNRAAAITAARTGAKQLWAGTVTIHPNAKTGAHHHGDLESIIYVVRGRARMRWGEKLEFVAEAGPGDFIYVPPYVPHQEINANPGDPLDCVIVRSGQEPVVVNLDITPTERVEEVRWVDGLHEE
jgi:uncharacterized RmlC-like cupin family protein/transcriptional regulator with XRE-family HTH domain